MRLVIFTLLIFNAAELHVAGEHLMCERLDGIFSEDGRHRQIGPKGNKGDIGLPGVPGPPGQVDYAIINGTIDYKVGPVLHKLTENVGRLSDRLTQLESQLELGNASAVVVPEMVPTVNRQEICKVWLPEKCYWAVVYPTRTVNFTEAKNICSKHSGFLANLYNPEQYRRIKIYLRRLIPKTDDYVQIHLGMRVDQQSRSVSLRDGTPAYFLPWYRGYPEFRGTGTHVHLTVRRGKASKYQGMHDYPPTYHTNGALCEL